MSDQRKQSLYLSQQVAAELASEAVRLDRPMSWLVQQAWLRARRALHAMPLPPADQAARAQAQP